MPHTAPRHVHGQLPPKQRQYYIKKKAELTDPEPNPFNDYHTTSAGDTTDISDTTTNDYYSDYDSSSSTEDTYTDDDTTTTSDTDSDSDTSTTADNNNNNHDDSDASSEEEPSSESPPQQTPTHPVNRTSANTTQATRNAVVTELNRVPARRRLGRVCKRNIDYSGFY